MRTAGPWAFALLQWSLAEFSEEASVSATVQVTNPTLQWSLGEFSEEATLTAGGGGGPTWPLQWSLAEFSEEASVDRERDVIMTEASMEPR